MQPSHDEQIVLMIGSSCHMLSDSTCLTGHFDLSPVGSMGNINAKQKQPAGCKKVRGQSEATNINDQKL